MMKWLLYLFPLFAVAVSFPEHKRPSHPFVSGDGFRFFADAVFDEEDSSLDPLSVKEGNTIFVKLDRMEPFFREIHPRIPHRYILITHNGDDDAPGAFRSFLDDPKLIAWFTQNLVGDAHPKLHPIPIGIANRYWGHGNAEMVQKAIDQKSDKKEHLLYFNLTIQNYYPERWEVFQRLGRAPFCFRTHKKRFDQYLVDVSESQFVASPRGNGLDTHRLWEALYMGSYPIVKSSSLDPLYEGLPVLVVQDWAEVTESYLKEKYEEMRGRSYDFSKLSMEYWEKLIDSYRSKTDSSITSDLYK
jgi:hypothetical protein